MSPIKDQMKANLVRVLQTTDSQVNIKARTHEKVTCCTSPSCPLAVYTCVRMYALAQSLAAACAVAWRSVRLLN